MPILALLYAVFCAFVTIASLYSGIKDREPRWYVILGFVANLVSLGLFVAHWLPPFDRRSSFVAAALFLFSLFWSLGWGIYHSARSEERDFSPEINRLYKRFVLTFAGVLSFPAYWFGGIAAFRSL